MTTLPVAHASQFESCCGCSGETVPWRLDVSYTLDGPDCPSPGSYTYQFEYQDQCLWTSDGGATNATGAGITPLPDGTVVSWGDTCDYQTPSANGSNPLCEVTNVSLGEREYATCGEEASTCGNGSVEGSEECDDGNTTSGDGCSALCHAEGSGGRGWWLAHQATPDIALGTNKLATLSGLAFVDLDADGVRDRGERLGFAGAVLVATRREDAVTTERHRATVDWQGRYTLDLPAGTYALTWEESPSLTGFVQTTPARVVRIEGEVTADFGWRDARLLGYEPCLVVHRSEAIAPQLRAMDFLAMLRAESGFPVTEGLTITGSLMTREAFLTLLHRTHCLPRWTDINALQTALGRILLADPRLQVAQLIDLPLRGKLSSWMKVVYSGLATGLRYGRETKIGLAADGSAPIRRAEIVAVLEDVLSHRSQGTASRRPATAHVSLPASLFPPRFGLVLNAGVTWEEGALILARSAFTAGKIDLSQTGASDLPARASSSPPGNIAPSPPPCLVRDETRARTIRFSGVTPSDGETYWQLRFLASLGAVSADNSVRWLLAGDPHAEYGVRAGSLAYDLDQPVSLLELLRSLAVITCHPVETEAQTVARLSGSTNDIVPGTGDGLFTPDRIAATKDDASFAARVLHSVQRPRRAFNLSLTSFAPEVLRRTVIPSYGLLSVEDAAPFLASAQLYRQVNAGVLSPLEADNQAAVLKATLQRQLTGADDVSRRGQTASRVPFTRRKLVAWLFEVLSQEYGGGESYRPNEGEAWWDWVQ